MLLSQSAVVPNIDPSTPNIINPGVVHVSRIEHDRCAPPCRLHKYVIGRKHPFVGITRVRPASGLESGKLDLMPGI